MRVLFVSNSTKSSNPYIVDDVVKSESFVVKVVNYLNFGHLNFIHNIFAKIRIPFRLDMYNIRLLIGFLFFRPDIVFVVKGVSILPLALIIIKRISRDVKIISWSQDNMCLKHNNSVFYLKSLKLYDLVVTQKSDNVKGLIRLGAKKVLFQDKAYSPRLHFPRNRFKLNEFENEILFIGYAEETRFQSMLNISNAGFKVTVYGSGWDKFKNCNVNTRNLHIYPYDIKGEDYRHAIENSLISLCFLRKINNDQQTSRSIEIPACGGFMLAEDTNEHRRLFLEDEEAVYFKDDEELLDKVHSFTRNPERRNIIAQNGYKRCVSGNYTYINRFEEIVKVAYEK